MPDTITPHYDPMISKLIVWGANRVEATQRMDRALSEFVVNGVTTNIGYLRRIIQRPFRSWNTQTNFLEKYLDDEVPSSSAAKVDVAKIAAAIRQYEFSHELANRMVTQQSGSSTGGISAWAVNGRRANLGGGSYE